MHQASAIGKYESIEVAHPHIESAKEIFRQMVEAANDKDRIRFEANARPKTVSI